MTRHKYFTADITWCDCGCTNRRCERNIYNLNPLAGCGFYSVADYSNTCSGYHGRKPKEDTDGIRNADNS